MIKSENNIRSYSREVYYYETDRMGIVHHSNYIRWMEEARIDYLAQIGLPYDEMEKKGILIPVLQVQAEYKKPFRFGDRFCITLRLTEFTGLKFGINYTICLMKKSEVEKEEHAVGYSSHAFLDSNMMPVRLKKHYPQIYDGLSKRLAADREIQKIT